MGESYPNQHLISCGLSLCTPTFLTLGWILTHLEYFDPTRLVFLSGSFGFCWVKWLTLDQPSSLVLFGSFCVTHLVLDPCVHFWHPLWLGFFRPLFLLFYLFFVLLFLFYIFYYFYFYFISIIICKNNNYLLNIVFWHFVHFILLFSFLYI